MASLDGKFGWIANGGFARATEALLVARYWDIVAAQRMQRRRNVTCVAIALTEKSFYRRGKLSRRFLPR
jgi:hypothetical protein